TPKRRILVNQIPAGERYRRTYFIDQAELPSLAPKILGLQLFRCFPQRPFAIPGPSCPLHHRTVDIEGQNVDVPGAECGKTLAQEDCQRVWLFAGSAPDR